MLVGVLVVGLVGVHSRVPAAGEGPDRTYGRLVQEVGGTIKRLMREDQVPGVAIGLVDGQRIVWTEGFGFANIATHAPVGPETVFSVQSISKTYTATAFVRAIDRKLIGLDDRLVDVLPGFTIRDRYSGHESNRITMRQLLSHWAGLCQEAPVGNNYGDWHCSLKEHIASIEDSWLRLPVGRYYRYSNLGVDLAGYALSVRMKKPFEDLMQSELLGPLGMSHSSYRRRDAEATGKLATGYVDGSTPVPPLEIPMVPSGGLYSSVDDMLKYVRFQLAGGHIDGKPWISGTSLRLMETPQFSDGQRGRGYGLGLQSRPFHGGWLCTHGGGGYGFGTIQSWMPDYQIGAVVLTNGDQGGDLAETVAREALEGMIRLKKGQLPTDGPYVHDSRAEVKLEASLLRTYEGTYKATSGLAQFRYDAGHLHFHRQQSDVILVPRSPTEFTDSDMTQSYRFDVGTDGYPTGVLQLGDVGQDYMFVNDRPTEPRGPNLPEWRGLVGAYSSTAYGQPVTEQVSLKNGYLYWASGLKLIPYRPNLFFTADGDAVQFWADGRMTFGNRRFRRAR